MFQNALQARDWLKELGYPVLEPLINSPPQLKPSASRHISEWVLLVKIEDGNGQPLYIYWIVAKPESRLNDLKYVVDAYRLKYPHVLALFITRYQKGRRWLTVLMCPEPHAPSHRWGATLAEELAPDNARLWKALQYNPSEPAETLWRRVYRILRGETMNARIEEAFESFIMELESIRAEIDAEIQHATQRQEYDRVETLAREARQLGELIKKVQQLRTGNKPSAPATQPAPRRRSGEDATPQPAYTLPLLQALVDLGGKAPKRKVLERVHELMKDRLKPADYEELPSGGEIRWENKVAWLRVNLIKQGYLCEDTPLGIWAITDKGRQYLEQLKNS
jgi:hypothetical protein